MGLETIRVAKKPHRRINTMYSSRRGKRRPTYSSPVSLQDNYDCPSTDWHGDWNTQFSNTPTDTPAFRNTPELADTAHLLRRKKAIHGIPQSKMLPGRLYDYPFVTEAYVDFLTPSWLGSRLGIVFDLFLLSQQIYF